MRLERVGEDKINRSAEERWCLGRRVRLEERGKRCEAINRSKEIFKRNIHRKDERKCIFLVCSPNTNAEDSGNNS